ncbi:MAG: hypothetical protein RRB13_00500 [bacterium]|nr:hypothetical protein [bacterium]
MFLHQLRTQFKKSIPVSEGFFKLMKSNFGFYIELCNDFHASLGTAVEQNRVSPFLQEDLRPRLFSEEVCRNIEAVKKAFLSEIIKLEQFVGQGGEPAKLNDLSELKSVADSIYELLQSHWEFYKYQKSVVTDRVLVAFIQEIDRIGICWDSYVEKYLAATRILGVAEHQPQISGMGSVKVYYHLPLEVRFSLDMAGQLNQLFSLLYEFVNEVFGRDKQQVQPLEVMTFEAAHPVHYTLALPKELVDAFARLVDYLSIDVIKRETLVKYVMEVVQQQQGQDMAKPVMNGYLKKISKCFEGLPAEGYLSIDAAEDRDSVMVLSQLTQELDRMKVEYKDLMQGAERRLARNRLKAPAEAQNPELSAPPQNLVEAPNDPSTVQKISVAKKEHHGFLTS